MSAPQGTPEWHKERAGHATASCFKHVLAKIKTGEASVRRNYRFQLVTERLTGIVSEGFKSAAMQWGIDTEPRARIAFEARTGTVVRECGFLLHPTLAWCGASPDGLIDDDGVAEIKCPEPQTHLEWLERGDIPSEHIPQIQGQLWVTGRKYADFISYDPRFPDHMRLFVVRVQRDDTYIAELEKQVSQFLLEVEQLERRLRSGAALLRAA